MLSDFLLDPVGHPDVFVLEGGPGIGKSTLWQAAVREAGERRYRLLASQPIAPEARLAFAGLSDLLRDVLDVALLGVGRPRRRALEVARLRREPAAEPPDERAIAFGLVSVLRVLARDDRLLLAVDDLHWLDEASRRALLFAVRRLAEASAKVLYTRRTDPDAGIVAFERSLAQGRLRRLDVGPVTATALQRIVGRRLGARLAGPTASRLREASAGNPFYALELARALAGAGEPEPGAPLPIPASLDEVTRARLARLGEPARDVLATAALLPRPTVAAVRAVVGNGRRVRAALVASAEADVLELSGERIRFSHPLLAEAALASAPSGHLRDLHRRAAAVASSPEERARHLALAAEGQDETVAAVLEQAAREVRVRGARRPAAELADLADKLTPTGGGGEVRRQLLAARYHGENGDVSRMKRRLEELVATLPAGRDRAEARYRHG